MSFLDPKLKLDFELACFISLKLVFSVLFELRRYASKAALAELIVVGLSWPKFQLLLLAISVILRMSW